MTQTKEQINELESHLEKYGYIRPKGKGAFFFFFQLYPSACFESYLTWFSKDIPLFIYSQSLSS